MTEKTITAAVTILLGIIGVAVIALLVSNQANTGAVIGAGSGGFRDALCTALSPIGGCSRSLTPNVNSTITFPGM